MCAFYGDVDYYDISDYRHVCGWCIGKDYMYLNYILSAQQTEYIYIINKRFVINHCILGGSAYPVQHYPLAIRLRDRKGRAILYIALFPQSGGSSGAILGVRSVALLHLGSSLVLISPKGLERLFLPWSLIGKGQRKNKELKS